MINDNEDLLDQASCGIFSCNETGVITTANAYCSRLLEYEVGELTKTNISAILTLSGRIFYQTHLYPLIKLHQRAEEIFINLLTKSKKDLPVILNAVVVTSKNGFSIIFSFIQVLNRSKYEDEILQAKKNAEDALNKNQALEQIKQELELQQKELDKKINLLLFQNSELVQLGNIVTHDLQEPLRKLVLFSNELTSGKLNMERKAAALSVIQRSSQRIRNLLQTLQEYLSLSNDGIEQTGVNLNSVLHFELKHLQEKYPGIRVHADFAELPLISGYHKQLHLLFHHLLNNAFVYAAIDNNLYLTIRSVIVKGNLFNSLNHKFTYVDYVKISIRDKGPGFENTYKDYIFKFFKRIDPKVESVGFGLAFCRKIAENHFGEITAEGSPGIGATFTLMLPVGY